MINVINCSLLLFIAAGLGTFAKNASEPAHCLSRTNSSKGIDVYWINLERSTDRRQFMQRQLEFYGFKSHHRG